MIKRLPTGFASPIILLVVGLIVGIGITFAYFRFSGPKNFEIDTAPENTKNLPASSPLYTPATVTAQKDETANWKTYTSDKYKFSLKYPDTLGFCKFQAPNLPICLQSEVIIPSSTEPVFYTIAVYVNDNTKKLSVIDWLHENQPSDILNNLKITDVKIDNLPAKQLTGLPSRAGSFDTYIERGDKIYSISLQPFNNIERQEEFKQIYLKILSTLKFL